MRATPYRGFGASHVDGPNYRASYAIPVSAPRLLSDASSSFTVQYPASSNLNGAPRGSGTRGAWFHHIVDGCLRTSWTPTDSGRWRDGAGALRGGGGGAGGPEAG